MAFSPASPLTGAAIVGLTSPTYTFVADVAPSVNAKQYAVTALGGTQTNVVAHSPDVPFTFAFSRPKVLKSLGTKNPITGMYPSIPMNEYRGLIRKAMPVQAGQYGIARFGYFFTVPAGAVSYEPNNLRALFSLAAALISNQAQGMETTGETGVLG